MESTEVASNDQENAKGCLGVFNLVKEFGVQAERQGDFGGLVEIGLQDVPVEFQKGFQDGEFVLVGDCFTELGFQVVVGEVLVRLKALVRQGGTADASR